MIDYVIKYSKLVPDFFITSVENKQIVYVMNVEFTIEKLLSTSRKDIITQAYYSLVFVLEERRENTLIVYIVNLFSFFFSNLHKLIVDYSLLLLHTP